MIFDHQFSIQTSNSTTLAILYVYSQLIIATENKKHSCCIFLDSVKAFNTVDQKILINKLEYYDIKGTGLKCFASYPNRTQKVWINDINYAFLETRINYALIKWERTRKSCFKSVSRNQNKEL